MTPNLEFQDRSLIADEEAKKMIKELSDQEIVTNLALWLDVLMLKGRMYIKEVNLE